MKKFLDNLKPKNTFIVFTHCDKNSEQKDEEFIKKKLASLKKFVDLDIPFENVVLFDKTKECLEEFVEKMVPG
jgi:GTPase involved in cell partitioning and DNA repair